MTLLSVGRALTHPRSAVRAWREAVQRPAHLRGPNPGREAARRFARRARTLRRVPAIPWDATTSLDSASDVILQTSSPPWEFNPEAYSQEVAFAVELASRGRSFAVSDRPNELFGKNVVWFLHHDFGHPRLWDYSRQAQEFASGLERQGNRLFCSASETAYWENKAHMHRRLAEVDAPTPATRVLTRETWESISFDFEPVLIKQEHSAGSAGIHHFTTAQDARLFVEQYVFRPTESLIMQEVVCGADRDLRVTMVGDRVVASATYWRAKHPDAASRSEWTTTATTYDSLVDHSPAPEYVPTLVGKYMQLLGVRTAGFDLMWVGNDLSTAPLILEFSPYYQPNPPKPNRYGDLSYKQFKTDWAAPEGYLEQQHKVFREISGEILDQGLF